MSELDKPVPPAGEDIHLPGGSIQPLLLTIGITMILIGVTEMYWIMAVGIILTVATLVAWVRDAMREINSFPLHHDEH
ncbi:MAG: cytochrome c oxidase subunit 4 [Solirubrobacteraceae bacterium]|nr:cytochrome c oxidase subunit 4 [Solirubrobacteraceae bacterium]